MRRLATALVLGLMVVGCNSPVVTPAPSGVAPSTAPSIAPASIAPVITPNPEATPDTTEQAHDLLLAAIAAAAKTPSAHMVFKFDGSFDGGGLTEAGDVTDVTLEGDVNPTDTSASFHFAMPEFDDMTLDVIVIGDTEYARSSLGGNTWVKHPANGTLGQAVGLISDPALLTTLEAALKDGRANITMSEADSFGDTPADAVTVNVMIPVTDDSEPFLLGVLGKGKDSAVKHWPKSDKTMKMPLTVYLDKEDHSVIGLKLHFGGGENDVAIKGSVVPADAAVKITAPKGAVKGDNPFNPPNR